MTGGRQEQLGEPETDPDPEPETRIDKPEPSREFVDDRPGCVVDDDGDDVEREQADLFANLDPDQASLSGDSAHSNSRFEK